jgi:hypothetical protein
MANPNGNPGELRAALDVIDAMQAEVERLKAPVAAIAAVRDHERAVTCPALAPDAAHQPRADATHWWAIGRLEVAALIDAALAATDEPLTVIRRPRDDDAPSPVAEAERAVVEAAKAWRTATMDRGSTLVETMRDLRDAVDALVALEVERG